MSSSTELFIDEESALLTPSSSSSSSSVDINTTFDVPNSDVKNSRKFAIASFAMTVLVLVCYVCAPHQSLYTQVNMEMQEVARLSDGRPTIVVADSVTTLPSDTEIFSGGQVVPSAVIPHVSDASNTPPATVDHAYMNGGLLLCTAEVELTKTPYSVPEGCAFVSDLDLYYKNKKPANILIICAPSEIGHFPLDSETLESFGLVDDGKSLISTIEPGSKTSVAIYSGGSFDGANFVLEPSDAPRSLVNQPFFNKWKQTANDNVNSLIFQSTASGSGIPRSCKDLKSLVKLKEVSL